MDRWLAGDKTGEIKHQDFNSEALRPAVEEALRYFTLSKFSETTV